MHKCIQCEYQCNVRQTLKQHINSKHLKITYKCDQCDLEFMYSRWLRKHKAIKHLGLTHNCDQCDSKLTTLKALKSHIETKHAGIYHTCPQCGYQGSKKGLQRHKREIHLGITPITLKCDKCEYQCKRKGYLKQHIDSMHLGITHKCNQCEHVSPRLSVLQKHQERKHTGIKKLGRTNKCDQCDLVLATLPALKSHTLIKHLGNTQVCDQCDLVLNSTRTLKIHKETKHGTAFTCTECNYQGSKAALQRHMREKHLGINHKCGQCESVLKCSVSLKKHKESQHGKTYTCTECCYQGNKRGLQRHKREQHLDTRTRKCDLCEYQSKFKNALKQHLDSKHLNITQICDQCEYVSTTHHELKSHKASKHLGIAHKCDQCDSTLTTSRGLKRHKETKHTGIQYTCPDCEYQGSKSALKKHMNTRHLGIMHKCDQCDSVLTTSGDLTRHKVSKHEIQKYPCPICGLQVSERSHQQHKRQHMELTHECDQCESAFATTSVLKSHKESLHERYSCTECGYQANRKQLEHHTKTTHLEMINKCDQFEWFPTSTSDLKIHTKKDHTSGIFSPQKSSIALDYKSHIETPLKITNNYLPNSFNSDTVPAEEYACLACDFKAADKKHLNIHTDAIHDGITYGKY